MHRVENEAEQLDIASFERIGRQVDELVAGGRRVVLVSSGARKRLPDIGWPGVVEAWRNAMHTEAEDFLLTEKELDAPEGCRDVFAAVACVGRVAVVNADDDKLSPNSCYRNNDIVAAVLARHIGQSTLMLGGGDLQLGILSDVNGVLEDVSKPDSVIRRIDNLGDYEHLAGGSVTKGAIGGMATKFEAARIAMSCGINMWVAHGRAKGVVHLALQGQADTHFAAHGEEKRR